MTRTGVMASSRPHKDGAGLLGVKSTGALRRLSAIAAVLLLALALALPSAAFAAEPTAGYNQTPTTPSKSGTAPSKETSEPAKESTAPTATTSTEPAKALPFTGLDLRWSIAIGVLLMGAGFSIVVLQRRRSDS